MSTDLGLINNINHQMESALFPSGDTSLASFNNNSSNVIARYETSAKVVYTVTATNIEHSKSGDAIDNLILNILNSGMSDKDAIYSINKWCTYSTNYDYSYSIKYATGLINNKKGTCNAYADLVKTICDRIGIPCQTVLGNGGNHIWNRVQIGGSWYYLDCCWNACGKSNNYYLSKNLWSDHSLS